MADNCVEDVPATVLKLAGNSKFENELRKATIRGYLEFLTAYFSSKGAGNLKT